MVAVDPTMCEKRRQSSGLWTGWSNCGIGTPSWVLVALSSLSVTSVAFKRSDGVLYQYRRKP